jgi:hypothetical protein
MRYKTGQDAVWVRINLTRAQQDLVLIVTGEPATALEMPLPTLKTHLRARAGKADPEGIFERRFHKALGSSVASPRSTPRSTPPRRSRAVRRRQPSLQAGV